MSDESYTPGYGGSGSNTETAEAGGYSYEATATNDAIDDLIEDEPETAPVEAEKTDTKVARDLKTAVASSASRPKAGQFSWSDVESIIKFVAKFEAGSTRNKDVFKSVFGVAAKADALTVAQSIHSTTGSVAVYKDATAFIESIVKKTFGMTEVFALISDLSRRDDDYVRDFFKVVNAFLTDEVRYRKNAPLPSLLQALVEGAQTSLTADDKKVIDWIGTLLNIWPK